MRATICKWGNSLALRIPKSIAEDVALTEGSVVELCVKDGRLVAEPLMVEDLRSLLARVTSKNRHKELFVDSPKGSETL